MQLLTSQCEEDTKMINIFLKERDEERKMIDSLVTEREEDRKMIDSLVTEREEDRKMIDINRKMLISLGKETTEARMAWEKLSPELESMERQLSSDDRSNTGIIFFKFNSYLLRFRILHSTLINVFI